MTTTFAEFQETLTLEIPRVENRVAEFAESRKEGKRGLIVEVAAIHSGLTTNFNNYSTAELERSLNSWVSPYPKPIIMNHDIQASDPIGRVMAAKMDEEQDGTKYVRLQIAVTDPDAIEKILDQRYLTGSVGGKSNEAVCSVCSTDWARASMQGGPPCKHSRGKTYKGVLAYLDRKNIAFHEYSIVNAPADNRSVILGAPSIDAEEADDSVRLARFFDLNMGKQEIVEFAEAETRDVLAGMRKKEAGPLYLSLKGAFLSALAVNESELDEASPVNNKENFMTNDESDDILAVTEGLSADLKASSEKQDEDEPEKEEAQDGDGVQPVDGDGEPGADPEEAPEEPEVRRPVPATAGGETNPDEEVAEDDADKEEEVTEAVRGRDFEGKTLPQGQEKLGRVYDETMNKATEPSPVNDPDPFADHTRESASEGDEKKVTEEVSDTGLGGETDVAEYERRVQELTTQNQAVLEENARLKKALHRTLVERVVDTKIAVGLVPSEERDEQLEEHATRTAASLADSLRDLSKITANTMTAPVASMDPIERRVMSVPDDGSTIETAVDEKTQKVDPEKFFTDVFMGREAL